MGDLRACGRIRYGLKVIIIRTYSRDNEQFRSRSMEKQRGMAFGFRKTATAVKKPDRQIDG